jgi:hypothetical protein
MAYTLYHSRWFRLANVVSAFLLICCAVILLSDNGNGDHERQWQYHIQVYPNQLRSWLSQQQQVRRLQDDTYVFQKVFNRLFDRITPDASSFYSQPTDAPQGQDTTGSQSVAPEGDQASRNGPESVTEPSNQSQQVNEQTTPSPAPEQTGVHKYVVTQVTPAPSSSPNLSPSTDKGPTIEAPDASPQDANANTHPNDTAESNNGVVDQQPVTRQDTPVLPESGKSTSKKANKNTEKGNKRLKSTLSEDSYAAVVESASNGV